MEKEVVFSDKQSVEGAVRNYLNLARKKLKVERELAEIKMDLKDIKWELNRILSKDIGTMVVVSNDRYCCLAAQSPDEEPILIPMF